MANPAAVLIIIGILLVVLALFVAFSRPKGSLFQGKRDIHTKRATIQLIIGLSLALIGAFLMFNGTLLGVNTISIARIIGIIGILLIGTSFTTLPFILKKEKE
ncbi:MAG TPA: hypothetical protein PKH80_00455 [Methanofastidiosum sp.]|nr:hypothetical protein [Methanofastidiosum sp.]HNU61348.1 hypothetical protein [Methanofastidiosum sp.]